MRLINRFYGFLSIWMIIVFSFGSSHASASQCYISNALDSASKISYYDYSTSIRISKAVLKQATSENNLKLQAGACKQLCRTYWAHAEYDSALFYGWSALKLLQSEPDCMTQNADILSTIGLLYFYVANYDSAKVYLNSSLDIYLENHDSLNISRVYNNIGLLYDTQGLYKESMDYLYKGMRYKVRYTSIRDQYFSESILRPGYKDSVITNNFLTPEYVDYKTAISKKDTFQIAQRASTIGNLNKFQNKLDSAMWYYEIAASHFKARGITALEALEYVDIGRCLRQKEEFEKALHYFLLSEQLLAKGHMYATLDGVMFYIAEMYQELGHYADSEKYLDKHSTFVDSLPHPKSLIKNHLMMAELSKQRDELDIALGHALKAYREAGSVKNLALQYRAAGILSELHREMGNYRASLKYKDIWSDMNNKILKAKYDKENMMLANAFNLQSRNNEILKLESEKEAQTFKIEKRNTYLIATITATVLILIFAILLYRRYVSNRHLTVALNAKNEQLKNKNDEIQILLQEVHHRVKNNLQMISSLISMQNRHAASSDIKDQLTLTQNRVKSIGLIHEFLYKNESLHDVRLKSYLEELIEVIQKTFKVNPAPKIIKELEDISMDIDSCISVGLILHELLINSLKYAHNNRVDVAPVIDIVLKNIDDEIYLKLEDDGDGATFFKKGFGWSIIDATVKSMEGTSKVDFSHGFKAEFYLKVNQVDTGNIYDNLSA